MSRAVFLDRDGVLNRIVWRDGKAASPRTVDELEIEPDAPAALASLRAAGFKLFVVTNQPDVRRGLMPKASLHRDPSHPAQRPACRRHRRLRARQRRRLRLPQAPARHAARPRRAPRPGPVRLHHGRRSGSRHRLRPRRRLRDCSARPRLQLRRPAPTMWSKPYRKPLLSSSTSRRSPSPQVPEGHRHVLRPLLRRRHPRHRRHRPRRRGSHGDQALAEVRERGGRLFLLGVGGSAGHASHATNDFRKICGFEAYCPTDNVSELTARINDEGWEGTFSAWLQSQPAEGRGRSADLLGRRRQHRSAGERQHRARHGAGQGARRHRSPASSAATAATPPRSPTPA